MGFDVDSYLRSHLPHVEESGKERVSSCPQCGKPGKFYASTTPPYGFLCFSGKCGVRGRGVINLICAVEGVSPREAERRLMKFDRPRREVATESLEDLLASIRKPPAETLVDCPLPAEYVACFDGKHWRWPKYLTTRGITRDAAQHFSIGFAGGGRYRQRAILPFSCPGGSAFVGRDMTGKAGVKYLSPKKADGYEAKKLVYGWPPDGESWEGLEVFIVEGPLDVVRMWQHGLPALSLLGKIPSIEKIEMVSRLGASGFIVLLDPEEYDAPTETAARLAAVAEKVWIAKLPDGVDPGKSTKEQVTDAYLSAETFRGRRSRDLPALLAASGRALGTK